MELEPHHPAHSVASTNNCGLGAVDDVQWDEDAPFIWVDRMIDSGVIIQISNGVMLKSAQDDASALTISDL